MVVFKTKKASETERLGYQLGIFLRSFSTQNNPDRRFASVYQYINTKERLRHGLIFGLQGDLGSGKTTFIKGLAKGLGVSGKITSPTYVFVRSYPMDPLRIGRAVKKIFYHLDLYRLEPDDRQRLESLNLPEILNDSQGLAVIEWPKRLAGLGTHKLGKLFMIKFDYGRGILREISWE